MTRPAKGNETPIYAVHQHRRECRGTLRGKWGRQTKSRAAEQRVAAAFVSSAGVAGRTDRRFRIAHFGGQEPQYIPKFSGRIVHPDIYRRRHIFHGCQVDDRRSGVVPVDPVSEAWLVGDSGGTVADLVNQPRPARTVDSAEPQRQRAKCQCRATAKPGVPPPRGGHVRRNRRVPPSCFHQPSRRRRPRTQRWRTQRAPAAASRRRAPRRPGRASARPRRRHGRPLPWVSRQQRPRRRRWCQEGQKGGQQSPSPPPRLQSQTAVSRATAPAHHPMPCSGRTAVPPQCPDRRSRPGG